MGRDAQHAACNPKEPPRGPAAQQPQQAQPMQTGQQMMVTGQPVAIPVTQTAGMQAGQPMMTGQPMAAPMGQGQMMMMQQNPPKQLLSAFFSPCSSASLASTTSTLDTPVEASHSCSSPC